MSDVFFHSPEALWRSFLLATGAYAGLIILLRLTGKRTLSKMNAFDLVVTVALGSTLATISLSKDTALLQGLQVFALLILLQYAVAWLSVRSERIQSIVKSRPVLLLENGRIMDQALRKERVTREEIHAAVRASGVSDMGQVMAVVLETDGSFSVLRHQPDSDRSALTHVKRIE